METALTVLIWAVVGVIAIYVLINAIALLTIAILARKGAKNFEITRPYVNRSLFNKSTRNKL